MWGFNQLWLYMLLFYAPVFYKSCIKLRIAMLNLFSKNLDNIDCIEDVAKNVRSV